MTFNMIGSVPSHLEERGMGFSLFLLLTISIASCRKILIKAS